MDELRGDPVNVRAARGVLDEVLPGLSFPLLPAYIKYSRTAVYRHLAKHTSGRKPTFSLEPSVVPAIACN
jgi:hypothetical protein